MVDENLVNAVVSIGLASVAFFFSLRWLTRRRILRQRGIHTDAEIIDKKLDPVVDLRRERQTARYTVSFTTNLGQVVTRKRTDNPDSQRVTRWVYDPERPKTAWQEHNLDSAAFSVLIWVTFGWGVLMALIGLLALADS